MDCAPSASPDERQEQRERALDEGIRQIEDRGYAARYEGSGKAVYKAAFAFLGRDDIGMKLEEGAG